MGKGKKNQVEEAEEALAKVEINESEDENNEDDGDEGEQGISGPVIKRIMALKKLEVSVMLDYLCNDLLYSD